MDTCLTCGKKLNQSGDPGCKHNEDHHLFDNHMDQASLHDVLTEIRVELDLENKEYTRAQLEKVFSTLSDATKTVAREWGLSDTVFRDSAYVYLLSNPRLLEP